MSPLYSAMLSIFFFSACHSLNSVPFASDSINGGTKTQPLFKAPLCSSSARFHVTRSLHNPLLEIDREQFVGDNVNGPTVIRVPDWIQDKLGKYYMYFGHHRGKHIRLAYSNKLDGPWTVYEPGVFHLNEALGFQDHIASPDIVVDHHTRRLMLYFHGVAHSPHRAQFTGVALSTNGLKFQSSDVIQGDFYFRVFRHGNYYYAIAKNYTGPFELGGGHAILRSRTGVGDWETGPTILPNARHVGVDLIGDNLTIYFTRTGDSPERIYKSQMFLKNNWLDWQPETAIELLRPETKYEGAHFSSMPSEIGPATHVNQLRDPFIFSEAGNTYIFYSGAGETTINLARIHCRRDEPKH